MVKAPSADHLYSVFSSYADSKKSISRCPCCYDEKDNEELLSYPLRKLPQNILGPFASSALATWGDVDDYRRFLPRILEIIAAERFGSWNGFDLWLIAEILDRCSWSDWPDVEQKAVSDYMYATWQAWLKSDWEIEASEIDEFAFFVEPKKLFDNLFKSEKVGIVIDYILKSSMPPRSVRVKETQKAKNLARIEHSQPATYKYLKREETISKLETEFFRVADIDSEYATKISKAIQITEAEPDL